MKKLLIILSLAILLTSCYDTEEVEKVSCDIVSQIIQEQWYDLAKSNKRFREYIKQNNYEPAQCAAVKLGEPLRKDYYHNAIAYLHNGSEFEITVEIKKGHIYVQMKRDPLWLYR